MQRALTEDAESGRLAARYWDILCEYLEHSGEVPLSRVYELSRKAMADGYGLLDMADVHHRALQRLLAESRLDEDLLENACVFFSEALSPFEMSHRGAREGARALRHLNEVLEAETKRIAHALHDEAGQLLASLSIALADVASQLPKATLGRFEEVEQLLLQVELELRNLSHELRPTVLDNLGLVPALEFVAEKVGRRTGLEISVSGETVPRLPAAVETALYRIVQEALNNIVKHAQAKSVRIDVKRSAQNVSCRVQDDGRGFDARRPPVSQGLGLLGIRERLNALGGSLQLISEARRGTTLIAEIPLGGG
jgi:signal transduction histidine kinase